MNEYIFETNNYNYVNFNGTHTIDDIYIAGINTGDSRGEYYLILEETVINDSVTVGDRLNNLEVSYIEDFSDDRKRIFLNIVSSDNT